MDRAPRSTLIADAPELPPTIAHRSVSIASAANLLVQNRYGEALKVYRALSEIHPDRPVFSDVVSILEVKLRCGQQGGEPVPCD
jgi:hypothetical protein